MKYIYTKEENKAYFRSEMESMKGIMKGVTYDSETGDTVLPPVEEMNENQLKFILIEGRNRQIRKMCAMVNLKVVTLKRVRIGNIRLGNIPLGQWCFLNNTIV